MLAILWGGSLLVLQYLPERVPIHWDLHNQVNGWGSRWLAALLLPGAASAIYLFLLAMDWTGIRIPPTLENREVWKQTHRFGGKVFVIGGTLLLPMAFLPEPYPMISLVAGLVLLSLIPIVYAYRLRAALSR